VSSPTQLHPAEHRAYRELYAMSQQLVHHWTRLSSRLGPGDETRPVDAGVETVRRLLDELPDVTARYGLFGRPAARGVGARVASARNEVRDRFLERGQALRMGLLDLHHLVNLTLYLEAVARGRGDETLEEFAGGWHSQLSEAEVAAREAVSAIGEDPDGAILPVDSSPAGRAGQRAANSMGTLGEWIDRRAARG